MKITNIPFLNALNMSGAHARFTQKNDMSAKNVQINNNSTTDNQNNINIIRNINNKNSSINDILYTKTNFKNILNNFISRTLKTPMNY